MEWHCSAGGDSNKLLASYYMQLKTLWSIPNTYAILHSNHYSFCKNIKMTEGSTYRMEKWATYHHDNANSEVKKMCE